MDDYRAIKCLDGAAWPPEAAEQTRVWIAGIEYRHRLPIQKLTHHQFRPEYRLTLEGQRTVMAFIGQSQCVALTEFGRRYLLQFIGPLYRTIASKNFAHLRLEDRIGAALAGR